MCVWGGGDETARQIITSRERERVMQVCLCAIAGTQDYTETQSLSI